MMANEAANDGLMRSSAVELTILMPCLNEVRTLGTCILMAQRYIQSSSVRGEILIADDGSTDGSQDLARSLGARVVDVPVRGYGAALCYGSSAARGRYVIMADSDASYDLEHLDAFLCQLRQGADLVMGNRFTGGIAPGAMPWKNRFIGNPVLSGIGRLFFRCPVRDLHCGIRGYSKDAFKRMDLRTTGMEFASEMVIKATLMKMKISEVPTTLSPDGRDRPPHLRPWHDGWRHLRFMLLYSPRWLFLYPGIALMVLGLALGGWLLSGPWEIGPVTFDIHTLFFAAVAVLVGFQAVVFAVSSKVFAITEKLLPPDRRLDRLFRVLKLEVGLGVGGLLVLGGLAASLYGMHVWGFRQADPTHLFRIVIPAGTSLALGCQIVMSSFFLSILGLGRR
jgi:glycosyltransferase involved in cell wall biosynthesis